MQIPNRTLWDRRFFVRGECESLNEMYSLTTCRRDKALLAVVVVALDSCLIVQKIMPEFQICQNKNVTDVLGAISLHRY